MNKSNILFIFLSVMLSCSCKSKTTIHLQTIDVPERKIVLMLNTGENNPRNSEGDFITLKNGRILFIYSHYTGGSTSDHAPAYLAGRFSDDRGKTWSKEDFTVLENEGGMNVMSVSLLRLQNGNIALFYLRKNSTTDCIPMMRISTDEAGTWSAPVACIADQKGYFVLNNNRVIQLKNGRLLLPVSLHQTPEDDKFSAKGKLFSYYSDDNGTTWQCSAEVPNPSGIVSQEPGVVELKDGTVMMLIRAGGGFQQLSRSKDKGQTWSPMVAGNLPSPLSPASIARIPSTGDLLVVWNNNDGSNPQTKGKRTPLTVAISKDEGKTWGYITDIETDPVGWYCYIAVHFTKKDVLLGYCTGSNPLAVTSISLLSQKDLYRKPEIRVMNPRCEQLTNPQGIDCAAPRLSWEIAGEERGIQQTAYRILAASSLDKLNANDGDLWDSQSVKSNASVNVPYGGKTPGSRDVCYWKVKVITNRGNSQWSEPASWSMGLLNPAEWQAQWTGLDKSFRDDVVDRFNTRLAARYFRKEFDASQKPVKATMYICGLGLYKLYINGKTIGKQELAPTLTDYSKVVKYNTFDVTNELVQGKNAIGVTLGNGRFFSMRQQGGRFVLRHYGFPKMLIQLELTYADGSRQTVVSDDSWKVTADGPIRANNEYDGEEYDATMEMPGWNATGFDDSKWLQSELVQAPGGKPEAQINRNIRVMETIRPVSVTQPKPGMYILDMGQNMVGWVSMKVKGKSGDRVKLRFAESLQDDGTLYLDNILTAQVTDIYTLKGSGNELFEPVFTYHGFRFVEITGYPGVPSINDFEGKVVYDEMDVTGHFVTSDETVNQIYRNAYWGIRGNYRGIPTDCPQRDERLGWLGDRAVGSHGESFIFGNNNLYAKWLDDIAQAQREDGSIPNTAPHIYNSANDYLNMTWPGTFIIIANMLYEQYGNKEPIVKHYDAMKKWMFCMREKYMENNIMPQDSYGDWCMPPESPELIHSKDPARKTDAAVLGTTFYYRMLFLLERFANLLNQPADAKSFADEAVVVKDAYNEKYFNRETAQYSNNTVTANLLSLYFGMVPDDFADKVFQNIVDKTEKEFDGHVSTGLVGIQWLMRGLSDYGRADLAFRIATNRGYPSWGYMIENGATTIWELWNGNTADPAMNSQNHVMLLGDLIVWFYEYLAGIQNAQGSAGFEKIVMRPYPVDGLDYVKASYHSIHGLISSNWQKKDNVFQWEITIPANSIATVYIPATNKAQVTESGQKASSAKGVKFVKMEGEYAVFEVGSGSYNFGAVRK